MKVHRRSIFILVIFVYVAFSLYSAYNVFFSTRVISRVHRVVKKAGATTSNIKGRLLASLVATITNYVCYFIVTLSNCY